MSDPIDAEILSHPSLKHCFGGAGNCTEPPAYLWVADHGGVYALCVQHCAKWRAETKGIPVLEPTRICSLPDASRS
jgi:hypothetical protein